MPDDLSPEALAALYDRTFRERMEAIPETVALAVAAYTAQKQTMAALRDHILAALAEGCDAEAQPAEQVEQTIRDWTVYCDSDDGEFDVVGVTPEQEERVNDVCSRVAAMGACIARNALDERDSQARRLLARLAVMRGALEDVVDVALGDCDCGACARAREILADAAPAAERLLKEARLGRIQFALRCAPEGTVTSEMVAEYAAAEGALREGGA